MSSPALHMYYRLKQATYNTANTGMNMQQPYPQQQPQKQNDKKNGWGSTALRVGALGGLGAGSALMWQQGAGSQALGGLTPESVAQNRASGFGGRGTVAAMGNKAQFVGGKRHMAGVGGGAIAGGMLGANLGSFLYGKNVTDPKKRKWRNALNIVGGIGGAILGARLGHGMSKGFLGYRTAAKGPVINFS